MLALGHLAARAPVEHLRLHDHDGIRVADRGGEQALGVGGRRRDRHLHAGRVHVVGLGRVLVELGRADAAARRHADRERELHRAARAPAVAADVGDQLVEAGVAEGLVLHLADRAPARHGEADRRAEDPRLGERRVDAAVGAEAVAQPRRGAEDAAGATDVLAHDHDRVVALHLHVEGVVDRLDERLLRHQPSRSAWRRVDVGVREDDLGVRRRQRLGRRDARASSARARRRAISSASSSVRTPSAAQVALVAAQALVPPLLLDALLVPVGARIVGGRVRSGPVGDAPR